MEPSELPAASLTWPSWFGFQVAPDFALQYSAELARVQRFEGIKLGGPFAEAFLETRSALSGEPSRTYECRRWR